MQSLIQQKSYRTGAVSGAPSEKRRSSFADQCRAAVPFALPFMVLATSLWGANDVAVPAGCTPDVNANLGRLLASGTQQDVDNVMVCGETTRPSRYQPAGAHGSHHVLSLLAHFPDGSTKLIEVVTNDSLDGVVTAPAHAQVFAYGQAFFSNTRQFSAGIHDTHCSTHRGADNGWVVVNGDKHPANCSGGSYRRYR